MASTKKTTTEDGSAGRGKQAIAILSPEDFARLDAARGRIPRSRYVADLILAHLDGLDREATARATKKR